MQGDATKNLHAFWDDLLGPSTVKAKTVIKTAKNLPAADATKASDLNVGHWVDEGVQNAKVVVYIAPVQLGAGPFVLTKKYQKEQRIRWE